MPRRLVTTATFAGLAGAIGLSLGWALTADGPNVLEALAQLLGLAAALTGILAERHAADRQRRRVALFALVDELLKNQAIINGMRVILARAPRRRVYPRLLVSAVDGIIASGVLVVDGRQDTFAKLHEWRNEVDDFNRRLDLTEMLTFLQGTPEAIRDLEQALGRDDGRLPDVTRKLRELLDCLNHTYKGDLQRRTGVSGTPLPVPYSATDLRMTDEVIAAVPTPRAESGEPVGSIST